MKYCEKCDQLFDIKDLRCPFCGKELVNVPDECVDESDAYNATDIINIMMITGII